MFGPTGPRHADPTLVATARAVVGFGQGVAPDDGGNTTRQELGVAINPHFLSGSVPQLPQHSAGITQRH
jgi:hypothetical protein